MSEKALTRIVAFAGTLVMVAACRGTEKPQVRVELNELDRVSKETWTALAHKFKDNVVRDRLNEMLVRDFGRSGRLFDIAAWESTYPDGRRHVILRDGVPVPALIPEYTDDGGHLNNVGRRWVSQKLLLFLAGL